MAFQSNRRWRRAMMAALEETRRDLIDYANPSNASRTDALRVIRMFEEVNGRAFDPLDKLHVKLVAGAARLQHLLRWYPLPRMAG